MTEQELFHKTRNELLQILETLLSGQPTFPRLTAVTEELVHFNRSLQTREVASKTLGTDSAELREQIKADLVQLLHNVTAVADAFDEQQVTTLSQINFQLANDRYNQRAGSLREVLDLAKRLKKPLGETIQTISTDGDQEWLPLSKLQGKNQDELIAIITSSIPIDQQINDGLGILLAAAVRGVHAEPTLLKVMEGKSSLMESYVAIRTLVDGQPFRDAVAASFAPFLAKILTELPVYNFDDTWRNFYTAVFSEVKKYYLTQTVTKPAQAVAQAISTSPRSSAAPITRSLTPTVVPQSPPVVPEEQPNPTLPPAPQQDSPVQASNPPTPSTPPPAPRPPIKPIDLQ